MGARLPAWLGSESLTSVPIETRVERFAAMGTRIELHVFGAGHADALVRARAQIEAVDDALTIHRPSPATAMNEQLAAGRDAAIDDAVLLSALGEVDDLVAMTGGLFDPTADALMPTRGWPMVTLDQAAARIRAACPLALDFGGFGKGYALDLAVGSFRGSGVNSAFLSAGESSIAVVGRHPMGDRWPVGIPDPVKRDRFLLELKLENEALSISSTFGTFANVPSRSPTIRPSTGETVSTPRTTIAVEQSGARAEAMSTALLLADDAERESLVGDGRNRRFAFAFADGHARTLIG